MLFKGLRNQELDIPICTWMAIIHMLTLIGIVFFFTWTAVALAGVFYALSVLGITIGYHRLLCHRTFDAPVWLRRFWATMGMLAMQKGPSEWVGHHRMHHAGSDTDKDPHNARQGFWYSHLYWMLIKNPVVSDKNLTLKFARDIKADPYMRWLDKSSTQVMFPWAVAFIVFPIGWAMGGWFTAVSSVLWAVFVRLVAVYHVTWLVNSACHTFGYRNYAVDDLSTNCWWVGLLSFGEGWHNNHHAHQDVAPAGHKWWEFDIAWQVIKLQEKLGLIKNVKRPPRIESESATADDPEDSHSSTLLDSLSTATKSANSQAYN